MTGDLYGPDPGASQPLPPAYTRGAAGQPSIAAGQQRPHPPFFGLAGTSGPEAAAPPLAADTTAAPVVNTVPPAPLEPPVPLQATRAAPPAPPAQTVASGTIPADAIYMPDAEIPKRRPQEPEPEFGGPARRPLSISDAAVMVAARLELLSARLKQQGLGALEAGFAGDPLDAALAGLISGYIAGRGR